MLPVCEAGQGSQQHPRRGLGRVQVKRLARGTLEAGAGPQEGVRLRGVVQRELRGGNSTSSQWGVKARAQSALFMRG